MTLASMTGFATQEVVVKRQSWQWDIRSVNGRGLEIRTRLPEGTERLDTRIRSAAGEVLRRGSVTISLRRGGRDQLSGMPSAEHLDRLFYHIATIQSAALSAGVTLAPITAADILDGRVLGAAPEDVPCDDATLEALEDGLNLALATLVKMREAEGETLARLLSRMISQIKELVSDARKLESTRSTARADAIQAAMRRVLSQTDAVDAGRLEQELALLAIKGDISEELDRLDAHASAAKSYLKDNRPVGRKLDFLTQEFIREANTLCSKAQFPELTRVGLDLKAVIDQVREQVQNVE